MYGNSGSRFRSRLLLHRLLNRGDRLYRKRRRLRNLPSWRLFYWLPRFA
jgi:hypothetical protein